MTLHYHPQLKELLRGNNPDSDVAINKNFVAWQDNIAFEVRTRSSARRYYDSDEKERALFRYAQEHQQQFGQEITANEVLVLVHPLYLPLTHMHHLRNSQQREEVDEYLERLLNLLDKAKKRQQPQVVLLDTLYHYSAATSLLLENGFVDHCVFTNYDEGNLHPGQNVRALRQKKLFIAGSYNDYCLRQSLKEIEKVVHRENIKVIPELVFDPPGDGYEGTLKPQIVLIESGTIPLKNTFQQKISLNIGISNPFFHNPFKRSFKTVIYAYQTRVLPPDRSFNGWCRHSYSDLL